MILRNVVLKVKPVDVPRANWDSTHSLAGFGVLPPWVGTGRKNSFGCGESKKGSPSK